jgi:hypothetical protein
MSMMYSAGVAPIKLVIVPLLLSEYILKFKVIFCISQAIDPIVY